ncbi:cell division protein FtsA [Helicobacter kayseriensis]|uniref:cell division protein FtsA n=1 Tax=Helicobacter kayseriensis TaxID=2905877 RepID=UPI001E5A9532|nr:cell division protein FtsA [Helicobacter kayseriensis]MCE3047763.1 cell division protein FtsA [Helicobacter kayseriensis]MCE3049138.1 cell division protein FtsA [Helicobacter kayseriensis]
MKQIVMAIDIGSFNISCAIAEVTDGNPRIIGVGFAKSQGIRKGAITNIEQAARSIKSAILDAKRMSGAETNRAIISISGVYAKSRNSSGVVTVPSGEIGHKEIHRVIQAALHNATIPAEYEAIHILPYQFMVDEQEYVDDPSGMSGSRLKALVHIVTAQKTALENLRRVVKAAGIEIENIVLSSYASSIAVLSDDERDLGVACIDIGGDTCDIMIHSGNSMCYDGILPVGSNHITKDIAHACNTSPNVAEDLKINYGDIASIYDHENSKILEVPTIGGEKTQQIQCNFLAKVIYARLTETLGFLYGMIDQNELKHHISAGIVFTGGLTQLKGLEDLINAFFKDYPTRLALPKEVEGMPEELKNPMCSAVVGLVLYGSGRFTNYEMDSEKRLKTKKNKLLVEENERFSYPQSPELKEVGEEFDLFKEPLADDMKLKKEGILDKFKKKLVELF